MSTPKVRARVFVAFCAIALAAISARFCAQARAYEFSNGLFDIKPIEGERAVEPDLTISDRFVAPRSGRLVDWGDDFEPIADDEENAPDTTAYLGRGLEFSQDVVVRGSVNLPSIKSLQFWGNAYSGSGRADPYGFGGRVKNNNTGASVGVTIPLGPATLSGFYNYHRDREFFSGNRVEQKDGSYGMAVYMNVSGFYFAASGFYGDDKYSGRGAADEDGVYAKTKFSGSQCAGYFETGYEMMSLGLFVLKPFGSYHYANVRTDKFDPTTLESLPGKKKYNTCRMTLGSRLDLNLAGLDRFTIQGRFAWVTELRKKSESVSTFCYGRVPGVIAPASPYHVGKGAGGDYLWAGVGLRLSLWGMFSVAVDYDALYNKRNRVNEGSLGLLFGF